MDLVIDLSRFTDFFSQPIDVVLASLLFYFGWIPLAFTFLWGSLQLWLYYRAVKWAQGNARFTILALDVPRGNEQTPKAVENLLSYLAGAHSANDLIETYWKGKFQLCFSLEIISIEGYTQFLIHTPISSRNLVETAIYSQYPDAEITEVDDYAKEFKDLRFPNDEYNLWGTEFIQDSKSAYPIKMYKEFEHASGRPETQYKDTMASLLDLYSSLGKGENLWFQIIIRPIGFDWMDKLDEEVADILGEKKKVKKNFLNKGADLLLEGMRVTAGVIMGGPESEGSIDDSNDDSLSVMELKPKQRKQVEAIHEKTSKLGYNFKMRMIYLAKKDVMDKAKAVSGFVGFMKQFKAMDLNGFRPDLTITGTTAHYFFAKKRVELKKNRILRNYIGRSITGGRRAGLLNIEEIATVWHFPIEEVVKAPLIQKTPGKKAEAPMTLPKAEGMVGEEKKSPEFTDSNFGIVDSPSEEPLQEEDEETFVSEGKDDTLEKGAPPSNLPFG